MVMRLTEIGTGIGHRLPGVIHQLGFGDPIHDTAV